MRVSLDQYKVVLECRVHWGQMDAAKHVNNTVYLTWSESARIAYFEEIKLDTNFEGGATGPILGWQDCKYIFPITYPDTAIAGMRTLEIKHDRLVMECAIFSKKHGRIAALSKQEIIPYDYRSFKKVEMPAEWVSRIKEVEQRDF